MSTQTLKIFKALSDKTRLAIVLDLLSGHETLCSEMKKKLSKSQPTLSHHIGKLLNSDILIETKHGANCYYKVNEKHLRDLGLDIKRMVRDVNN